MTLEIRFGVPKNQLVRVAKILYESFEDKFGKIFGDKAKFAIFISSCLHNGRTLVAFKDGLAVGLAGLEYDRESFINANLTQTLKTFGLRTFRIAFWGEIFLFNKAADNEILLDSLAVSTNERSKGIGSKLIDSVIDHARSHGFSQIRLEVIETNQKARRLYERNGFEEFKVQKIPFPFNKLLGFRSVTEMIYHL